MKDTKIDRYIDKSLLPKHHYITLELVRRKFISSESDFDLYLYDVLFEELLLRYDFKTVIVATNYVVTKVKQQKFCDEEGNKIQNLYAYFRSSITFNLKKIVNDNIRMYKKCNIKMHTFVHSFLLYF